MFGVFVFSHVPYTFYISGYLYITLKVGLNMVIRSIIRYASEDMDY